MITQKLIDIFHQIETPFYYYDMDLLSKSLEKLNLSAKKYNFEIHYALKANSNNKILQKIREFGLGADCVSGNEIRKTLELGFSNKKIVFAGVGKTDSEIKYAIKNSIQSFNCESIEEIEIINEWSKKLHKISPISLRLNPNINGNTHNFLTTGLSENKFGIPLEFIDEIFLKLKNLKNISLYGLHFHIGSQITSMEPYIQLCKIVNTIQNDIENKQGIKLLNINLGGGFGINYENPETELIPNYDIFFSTIANHLDIKANQKIHFELGRSIVGQMGSLISKVLYIKKGINKQFIILDAGMTDLIRPALYGSHHKIENISQLNNHLEYTKYDVVGPICESSDSFETNIKLPKTKRADLISIRSAGAYGEIMASEYNLRTKPKAIYSDEI